MSSSPNPIQIQGNNRGPRLVSEKVEALPIINHILTRLKINEHFDRFVPCVDKRQKLPPSRGLGLLLRNLLIARKPLYAMGDWAAQFDPNSLGLCEGEPALLNDDRIGRCLDSLFKADRIGFITSLVTEAARAFDLDMSELHNDSTSATLYGNYEMAVGQKKNGIQTKRITYGYNKDHRPDLKQLLFILTTTADGSVPVWCKVDHGNVADDQTHIETWNSLCSTTGRADFLYVADSKLCTRENMSHIDSRKGRFVTVMPKTRSEDSWFRDWIQQNEIPWTELRRRKNSRYKEGPDEVYRGFESPILSSEGYRIIWIWSSQKDHQDRTSRERRIKQASDELESLRSTRMKSPKSRLKSVDAVKRAVDAIFKKTQADKWFEVEVTSKDHIEHNQAKAGRPSANTPFIDIVCEEPVLSWNLKDEAIKYDSRTDGLFPLILNDKAMSLQQAFESYKRQPALEKRFEQLKSVMK